ncbi:MAG: 30S ribosomal protein S12 methylthiotransferase RimO [Helicobacteraceae bacterium]|nr:30S ribosomal protein S12 methylthiotransferase RimO [Helicobacteraceae bacterium]
MSKKLHVVSLGCSKNLVDTEVMMGRLKFYELTNEADEADVIIVNTCGFIDAAKSESINTVLDLHENRKEDSTLVMAGCLSERYQDELAEQIPEVDIFTGVGDYEQIDKLLESKESRFSDEVYLIDDAERVVTNSSYHAYIKISEGCNQTCSFCAIPSFKGKLNSRSLDSIVKEVESLVKKGFYDFSFVSQDTSSYLRDESINDGLIHLIRRIELIEGIKSARLLYLYPLTTTIKLLYEINKSKLFHNYFDMPLQHINDEMLSLMKRGSNKKKTLELMNYMRALPNSFVRTGLIVGHPHESEDIFDELCDFTKEFGFDRVSVFEYSDEEDTASFSFDLKVDPKTIEQRAEILGAIASEGLTDSLEKKVGTKIKLIVNGESDEHEFLLSAKELLWADDIDGEIYVNDKEIDEELEFGKIYTARVTELSGDKLIACIIKDD